MDNIEKKLVQAVKPGRVNFSNLIYNYQTHLSGFQRVEFTLVTYDNVQLPVSLFLKKTDGQTVFPTIIYNHSHGSCKWEASDLIQHCNQLGLNLCLYDSRGCGESSESFIYFGFREHIDLLYLVFNLNIVYKIEEIILWGRSIGCNTVLQFFNVMLSNEGSFNNKKVKMLMQSPDRIETGESNMNMFSKYQHSLKILNYTPSMFSENFNMMIDKHIDDFIEKNIKIKIQDPNFSITFRILGIVLDSPYDSFSGFIKDNMKKQIAFLSGLISSPVSLYLKSFYKKKLDIDLDKQQNSDLIKRTNINTVVYISDSDELIPLEKFNEFLSGFAEKYPKKNQCKIYNTKQRHGKKRPDDLIAMSITHLLENVNNNTTYKFNHLYIERAKNVKNSPQPGFMRNGSQAMLKRPDESRAKSAAITPQQDKVDSYMRIDNNYSDLTRPGHHQTNDQSFNRQPFMSTRNGQEVSLTQIYKDIEPNFDSLTMKTLNNDSNVAPKTNLRGMSPLHSKFSMNRSNADFQVKPSTRNPPIKVQHIYGTLKDLNYASNTLETPKNVILQTDRTQDSPDHRIQNTQIESKNDNESNRRSSFRQSQH